MIIDYSATSIFITQAYLRKVGTLITHNNYYVKLLQGMFYIIKNNICPLCGNQFSNQSRNNKDHLIPRAVALWSKELLTKQEYSALRQHINSKYNIYWVHEDCNQHKQSVLPTLSQVRKLFYPKEDLIRISKMFISLNSQLNKYRNKIKQIKKNQNHRCYSCKRKITNQFVIRRITLREDRTWNNACLVCNRCNSKYKDFTFVKKQKNHTLNSV